LHDTVDELRQAVAGFVQSDNSQWLIGRLGHRTPKEAYQDATTTPAAYQVEIELSNNRALFSTS